MKSDVVISLVIGTLASAATSFVVWWLIARSYRPRLAISEIHERHDPLEKSGVRYRVKVQNKSKRSAVGEFSVHARLVIPGQDSARTSLDIPVSKGPIFPVLDQQRGNTPGDYERVYTLQINDLRGNVARLQGFLYTRFEDDALRLFDVGLVHPDAFIRFAAAGTHERSGYHRTFTRRLQLSKVAPGKFKEGSIEIVPGKSPSWSPANDRMQHLPSAGDVLDLLNGDATTSTAVADAIQDYRVAANRLPIRDLTTPANLGLISGSMLNSLNGERVEIAAPTFTTVDQSAVEAVVKELEEIAKRTGPFQGVLAEDAADRASYVMALLRRDAAEITECTGTVFAQPLLGDLQEALATVREPTSGTDEEPSVTAEVAADVLGHVLRAAGFPGWTCRVARTMNARLSVQPKANVVKIRSDATFTRAELRRLAVHEVGTHAARETNSVEQHLAVLGLRLAHGLITDEGIAVYNEHEHQVSTVRSRRTYAFRLLAADLGLYLGMSDLAQELVKLGATEQDAADIAIRTKRGMGSPSDFGTNFRDTSYFIGNKVVSSIASVDGSALDLLMSCSLDVRFIDLLRGLSESGVDLQPRRGPHAVLAVFDAARAQHEVASIEQSTR